MKHRLPVIFAIISGMILAVLIVAGLVSPGSRTDRSSRLFGTNAKDKVTSGPVETSAAEETTECSGYENAVSQDAARESKISYEEPDYAVSENKEEEAPAPEPLDKYKDLLAINPYVTGWLKIDGTVIDEPVVYTPKSQNFFLHRALDGSYSEKGTLFIADNWLDGYNNTLIYGHNMKDGSGFGALSKFTKESYGRKHPIIHFDTLYDEREYELFAVFYSQIDEEELETDEDRADADKAVEESAIARKEESGEEVESGDLTLEDLDLYENVGDIDIYRTQKDEDNGRFRYYYYTDLSDRDDFDYFVNNVKERALYDTGVDAKWGDEFVTLSTCSYHVKNGRLIVVGRRVRD